MPFNFSTKIWLIIILAVVVLGAISTWSAWSSAWDARGRLAAAEHERAVAEAAVKTKELDARVAQLSAQLQERTNQSERAADRAVLRGRQEIRDAVASEDFAALYRALVDGRERVWLDAGLAPAGAEPDPDPRGLAPSVSVAGDAGGIRIAGAGQRGTGASVYRTAGRRRSGCGRGVRLRARRATRRASVLVRIYSAR